MGGTLAIRIDVDTSVGLRRGVPRLVEVFERRGVPATWMVVMGPDTMGRHAARFKKKGYLRRILSIRPLRMIRRYGGLAPFFYGTLLPSPLIGLGNPGILRDLERRGDEVVPHGYDHALWADRVWEMAPAERRAELERAWRAYAEVFGRLPHATAAPNWRTTDDALRFAVEALRPLYLADCRGRGPFLPVVEGAALDVPVIPPTLPMTHELIQAGEATEADVHEKILARLSGPYEVFTIHDWYEGLQVPDVVDRFVAGALARGWRFATCAEIAGRVRGSPSTLPRARVIRGRYAGGIGEVSVQGASP